MDIEKLKGEFQQNFTERSMSFKLSVILLLSNLLLAWFVFSSNQRVVVVPAEISQEVWIEKNQVSASYLEEMSYFMTRNLLDVTPEQSEFQITMMLNHVATKFRDEFLADMIKFDNEIKRLNFTSNYIIKEIKANPKDKSAIVSGERRVFMNGKQVENSKETFFIGFEMKNGRLFMDRFDKIGRE